MSVLLINQSNTNGERNHCIILLFMQSTQQHNRLHCFPFFLHPHLLEKHLVFWHVHPPLSLLIGITEYIALFSSLILVVGLLATEFLMLSSLYLSTSTLDFKNYC